MQRGKEVSLFLRILSMNHMKSVPFVLIKIKLVIKSSDVGLERERMKSYRPQSSAEQSSVSLLWKPTPGPRSYPQTSSATQWFPVFSRYF